jgi:outer membrane protein OmpA-like peptidoglycan-associated protein
MKTVGAMKTLLYNVAASIFVVVLHTASLQAQTLFPALDSTFIRVGIFGNYGVTRHTSGFQRLPGIDNCCDKNYGRSDSIGLNNLGLFAEYPLTSFLQGALRLQYSRFGNEFRSNIELVKASTNLNNTTEVEIQHYLATRLETIDIVPLVSIRPFKSLSLYAGPQFGVHIRQSFTQEERLVAESVVFVPAQKRVRNEVSGQLPNAAALRVALTAGLGYELPLNRKGTVLLGLEAFATVGVNSPVQGLDWRIWSAHAGASLRWSPHRTTELTAQEVQELYEDSLRIAQTRATQADSAAREAKKNVFSGRIAGVVGVLDDGKREPNPTVRVERFNLNESRYVLNHIFFPENSAVLASRYKRVLPSGRAAFSEDSVAKVSTLGAYHHVLNIVGKRMLENPQTRITLVGCNADVGVEKGNRKLSRQRAEAVASYLQEVWRVGSDRVEIQERDLPTDVSAAAPALAAEEHRRVELWSANSDILRDVTYSGERRTVTPPVLEIGLDISAGNGVKQWNLEISQTNNNEVVTLHSASGGANVPPAYRWDVSRGIPQSSENLTLQLSIDDQRNNKIEAPIVNVPVQQIPTRFTIHLAPFDERRAVQDVRVQQAVQFIKDKVNQGSEITITGYTDPTGDPTKDRTLSEARAQAVARLLNVSSVKIVAGGALNEYDNATPEGRSYNRLVRVEVKNPLR